MTLVSDVAKMAALNIGASTCMRLATSQTTPYVMLAIFVSRKPYDFVSLRCDAPEGVAAGRIVSFPLYDLDRVTQHTQMCILLYHAGMDQAKMLRVHHLVYKLVALNRLRIVWTVDITDSLCLAKRSSKAVDPAVAC